MKPHMYGALIGNFRRWMHRLDSECFARTERLIADLQGASPKQQEVLQAQLVVLNTIRAGLEPHVEGKAWPASASAEAEDMEVA